MHDSAVGGHSGGCVPPYQETLRVEWFEGRRRQPCATVHSLSTSEAQAQETGRETGASACAYRAMARSDNGLRRRIAQVRGL